MAETGAALGAMPAASALVFAAASGLAPSFRAVSPYRVLWHLLRRYWGKRKMLVLLAAGSVGLCELFRWQVTMRGKQQLRRRSSSSSSSPRATASVISPRKDLCDGGAVERCAGAASPNGGAEATRAAAVGSQARTTSKGKPRKGKSPKVDGVFLRRIMRLLPVLVPGWRSREVLLLVSQTAMLMVRSLLSIHISELIGQGLQAVLQRSRELFLVTLSDFFISGVLGALTNSALKYQDNLMCTWFRENLTTEVHRKYMRDENYYRAAVLMQSGECNLDNVDQRIVSDLHNFTKTLADLYSRTFKPALDVVLCTRAMAQSLGYRGPVIMYTYFMMSSVVLRAMSPPLAKLTAQQQVVEGDFRRCHARLLAHAEEVAFIAGARREEAILNERLLSVSTFAEHLSLMQFQQGTLDQFGLKYFASCVGWPIIALPFIMHEQGEAPIEWAAKYRVADDLIRQASAAFGDLTLVYKKLQILSGFTARVAELTEALDATSSSSSSRASSTIPPAAANGATTPRCVAVGSSASAPSGMAIVAKGATIETPDGRLLLKNLAMSLEKGHRLLVSGPNGAGKTSLLRTMAGLWPCKEGEVRGPRPGQRDMLYLPQSPYLVVGTLRDQVIYPDSVDVAANRSGGLECLDEEVCVALSLAGLERFAAGSLEQTHAEWDDVLSGGEKQRFGWARLFYHAPPYAALDEATSAINVQQEEPLYHELVKRGITLVSIAHRATVRKFHQQELNIVGDGSGQWTLTDIA